HWCANSCAVYSRTKRTFSTSAASLDYSARARRLPIRPANSAMVGLSAALHAEYGNPVFGVTALCLGFVHTPMVDKLDIDDTEKLPPQWLFVDLDRVAAAAIRAIRKNKGIVVVPLAARALWLLARLSPALVDWL